MLITDYSPNWPEAFAQIAVVLNEAAGEHLSTIEHVGSTSVPDLAAKPIIDIDLVYPTDGNFARLKTALEGIGYFHKGHQGIPGRAVFKRYALAPPHPVLDAIPHHLYACRVDNDELCRHLAFRDHLRAHSGARAEYQALKREIARLAGEERKAYAKIKEVRARDFVASVLAKAKAGQVNVGEIFLSGSGSTESAAKK
jgi:GrpB-like predicted nucleotidyltransferase (UPF0157 family)